MLSLQRKAEVGLLDSVDVDRVISEGTEFLKQVGEQCHPLASRYLHWIQKLEKKLPTLSLVKANNPGSDPLDVDTSSLDRERRPEYMPEALGADENNGFVRDEWPEDDSWMMSSEELLEIENLVYGTGWVMGDPTDY